MNHDTMMRAVTCATALAWLSCFGTDTRLCADGTRCPRDLVCSIEFGQRNVCVPEDGCGNGRLDLGESCDDGNLIPGDGCSADCAVIETCGDGVLDADNGEVCDDGNPLAGDGCSVDCRSDERCGNAVVDTAAGERCDDGNTASGDGCSADCAVIESCGNVGINWLHARFHLPYRWAVEPYLSLGLGKTSYLLTALSEDERGHKTERKPFSSEIDIGSVNVSLGVELALANGGTLGVEFRFDEGWRDIDDASGRWHNGIAVLFSYHLPLARLPTL